MAVNTDFTFFLHLVWNPRTAELFSTFLKGVVTSLPSDKIIIGGSGSNQTNMTSQTTQTTTASPYEYVECCNSTNTSCCWGDQIPGEPSLAEDFQVDLGEFTLIGPAPLSQDRTCVSGQTCWFGGLTGQDLSVLDAFAVIDTCLRVRFMGSIRCPEIVDSP